jgi:uroporphyrinogen decarboxylase
MTSKERISRILDHKEADRVPIVDLPWAGTLLRWKREGMPTDADWRDYFGVDKIEYIYVDNSPRYGMEVLEETDKYVISTTPWGVTLKNFKVPDSTPQFLDYKVNSPEKWEEAKKRMQISRDRINWTYLKQNFPKWRANGSFIEGEFWFGFDVLHSHMAGTETVLMAMLEDPEWVSDMLNTYLDIAIGLFDMVWDEGYHFDAILWCDDMGYKQRTFFSNEVYAGILQPVHKRAVEWAHNHNIKAHLHSCGNIMSRLPQLMEVGIDVLNPIEIKAGMDLLELKKNYGGRLALHGGTDALIFDKPDKVIPYIEQALPLIKEKGGYIFSSDHSIPNTVNLETYKKIVQAVKQFGAY